MSPDRDRSRAAFRAALLGVDPQDRDAWLDRRFGLTSLPDDGPELPRGCVPYLPCPVDALLRVIAEADVRASDVFVDVGAGVGRAAALVHLLTEASVVGIEVQPALVREARALAARLEVSSHVSLIEGDARVLARAVVDGTVFFFYCPFSGEALAQVVDDLAPLARARPLRLCCVDVELPERPWLVRISPTSGDVVTYRAALG